MPNVDVLIWDETLGVFCLEAKAVPLDWVEEFSPKQEKIRNRKHEKSALKQADMAMYGLLDYLKPVMDEPPFMRSSALWPCIRRADWNARWAGSDLPDALESSMVFEEDLEGGIEAFRERLEWIRGNPVWGNARPRPFEHDEEAFQAFARRVGAKAVYPKADAPEEVVPERRDAPSLDLGTDVIVRSAEELRTQLGLAGETLSEKVRGEFEARIDAVLARLREPFKIGVVGEFRAGKSSLVNALLGQSVAPVSEFECTFAPQRLYYAERPEGRVVYRDGRSEARSIPEVVALLAEPSTAAGGEVERTEIGLPAAILRTVELWDAPGFGGSDRNANVAEAFVEGIDAGLWVFNKDYMGQRSLDAMLQGLRQGGKLLVGVMNKCDDLFEDEYENLRATLARAYSEVSFASVIPFSATLAQNPDTDRDEEDGLALPADGNLTLLLETLERHIVSDPRRLSVQAAAGTLRSVAHAVRDAVQGELLAERRRLYLFETQRKRAAALLVERMEELRRRIERDSLGALRESLTEIARRTIRTMRANDLQDAKRMQKAIGDSMDGEAMNRLLDERFEAQRPWIEEFLQEIGLMNAGDYATRLTLRERLGKPHDSTLESLGGEGSSLETPAAVAGVTGATLGFLALLIPGPQWPFVVLAMGASYWASRKWGKPDRELSESDLRRVRLDQWIGAIDAFLDEEGRQIGTVIQESVDRLSQDLGRLLDDQMVRLALGGKTPQVRLAELQCLESVYRSLGVVVESFGNPLLELPPPQESLRQSSRIGKGDRERSAGLIRRVFTATSEVLAIQDGEFGPSLMPLLLETNDGATLRLLTWRSALSAEGEAFSIALSDLRRRRTGAVSVVAPVFDPGDAKIDAEACWIFMPGWAYRFSRPLAQVLAATEDYEFTPYEDDGSVYQQRFGQWWDGEASGISSIQF